MSENPSSRDKALEALDFIINVLKEHEQTLDESIGELATVTESIGKIDEINGKIQGVEDKVSNLQKEIAKLSGVISNAPKETVCGEVKKTESKIASSEAQLAVNAGSPMVLTCKQWSDFQAFAARAQTLTFSLEEKMVNVSALDGNQLFVYKGPIPELSSMLAAYLSQQLEVPKQSIIEGSLS
jgi:seryl-tRNA synthetase